MHPFVAALAGGALIGLSATALLWLNGRIAGVSGIALGLLSPSRDDFGWRAAFLGGLVVGGLLLRALAPQTLGAPVMHAPWIAGAAGILVGFGTQLGSGCTSGHGVCGLAAGSRRSFVAVLTFMVTGAVAVLAARHLGLWGLP